MTWTNLDIVPLATTRVAGFTFTSPVAGTAYVDARGWCDVYAGPSGWDNLTITIAPASSSGLSDTGYLVENSSSALQAISSRSMWSARTTLSVLAGQPTAVGLDVYRDAPPGVVAPDRCGGDLAVQIFTGQLP